jgi:hypothetical protein
MRFELHQRFRHPAEQVTAGYADPDLYATLLGLPKLGRIEVLRHSIGDEEARFSIRFAFTGDLPPAVTAVVDPERLTWVQESIHDLVNGTTTFRLVPDHYPERLAASGTARVRPADDGCTRIVAGDLRVKALLVSGKVEQAIISGLEEYLVAEAPAVDRYLARERS